MNNNIVLKSSVWYMISSFFLKAIGFITTPIFSRILTLEEYGDYNNFTAWLGIVSVISSLSLVSTLIRARFDFKDHLHSYVKTISLFGVVSAMLVDVVFIINKSYFCELFSMNERILYVLCAYILVSPVYDIFLSLERFKYKYKFVVWLTLIVSVSSVLLSLLFMHLWDDHLIARIIGNYLPSFIVSFVLLFYYLNKGKNVKWEYIKYSVPIAIPFVFHLLSGTILNSSDRTMIRNICGANDTALYSMAYNVALIVSVIWSSMNSAYSPWLGEKLSQKEYGKIKKSCYFYIGIFSVFVYIIVLFAPEILFVLGGEKYIGALNVIPPVMIGYYFVFIYSMYVNVEQFEKKTLGMAIATGVTAALNVFLNYMFIPLIGYIAAAYTTLACYIVLYAIHYVLYIRLRIGHIYDDKFIFLLSIFMVVTSFFVQFLYKNIIVRYAIVVVFLTGTIIAGSKNREKLVHMIKRKG